MITYSFNPIVIGKTYNGHQIASTGWIEKTSSIVDLMDATAIRGQAMMPGLLTNKGKLKKHLYQSCTIDIDVDNKGIDQTTWEDAIIFRSYSKMQSRSGLQHTISSTTKILILII